MKIIPRLLKGRGMEKKNLLKVPSRVKESKDYMSFSEAKEPFLIVYYLYMICFISLEYKYCLKYSDN